MVQGRNSRLIHARISDGLYYEMQQVMKKQHETNVSKWVTRAIYYHIKDFKERSETIEERDREETRKQDEEDGAYFREIEERIIPEVNLEPEQQVYKPKVPMRTKIVAPSRNAPCPCGSGKRYKKCCGKK
ncbi:MAG: hypothetical protein GY845_38300 [Planctomycetes bacterium]|nr:hypothetical protein [Planctomycetota bacterium]